MSDSNLNLHLEALANGAPFPITKEALISYAKKQNLEENLINELHNLSKDFFSECDDLLVALTKPNME